MMVLGGVSACHSGSVGWCGALRTLGRITGVSPFLRKVTTASGATAVQIAEKKHGKRTILEHLGSAHDEAELAALMQVGHRKLHANQPALDFDDGSGGRPAAAGAVVQGSASKLLVEVIRSSWQRLGFDRVEDEAFFQLVLARLVEPTSKLDSLRVIDDLGLEAPHRNTFTKALKRCAAKDYRGVCPMNGVWGPAVFISEWSSRTVRRR